MNALSPWFAALLFVAPTAAHAAGSEGSPAYQKAVAAFVDAARAQGVDIAPAPPQCLDFSKIQGQPNPKADAAVISCRLDLPCARLMVAGAPDAPQNFAISSHVDPTICQEARWAGYQRAFMAAFLRCGTVEGRAAALKVLADSPVKTDESPSPGASDPRIEARPEAIAFQAACGAMTAIREVREAPSGRNEDIVLKPTPQP